MVCDSDKRFLLLFTFLKKNKGKKVIVFMSSCNSVKYHAELLNYIDVPVLDLHVSCLCYFSSYSRLTQASLLSGQAKAAKANEHLLRVLQRAIRHASLHRRCRARSRHSKSRLDHPVRRSGRSARVHPSRRTNSARWDFGQIVALPAALRARLPALPQGCQGPSKRVHFSAQQSRECAGPAGEADQQELLLASECARWVSELPASIWESQSQAHL